MAAVGLAVLSSGCNSLTSGRATGDTAPTPNESGTSASVPGSFEPTEKDPDPSRDIEGVVITDYKPSHARPSQRVAYDKVPPYGGAHGPAWADCSGTVYDKPVRNENMVHSLEHGAVWIAFNPDQVGGSDISQLSGWVNGQPYMMLSPYPGLDKPISLQAWGHQLKVDVVADERIPQFIEALRANPYTTPESGAPCGTNPEQFDIANPPPFDPRPPGPGAMPVQGP
jgi:hypothetical protein